jgi:hypothetical protein
MTQRVMTFCSAITSPLEKRVSPGEQFMFFAIIQISTCPKIT